MDTIEEMNITAAIDIISAVIIIPFVLSKVYPGNVISKFVYYTIWFIYYLYVVLTTTGISKKSCNCNINTTYKNIVLVIFGLLIVSNLILFKTNTEDTNTIIHITNILFIIGTIAFAMFNSYLKDKGCMCTNSQSVEVINFVNIVTLVISFIVMYTNK
jgi:hypothetical protein